MSREEALTSYSPGLSLTSLFDIFYSPKVLFEALRERPQWLPWFVAAGAVPMIGNYVLIWILGFPHVLTDALEASGAVDTNGMIANAMQHRDTILAMQGLSALLGTWVAVLAVALLMLLMLMVFGSGVNYKQTVAVVAVSFLASAFLHYLIVLPVAVISPDDFHINRPLITNASFFLTSSNKYVEKITEFADAITLVGLLLLARGMQVISKRLSIQTASTTVFGAWIVYSSVKLLILWI